MQAPWWWSKNKTCRSDIYVYFNVNFNVFFKLIKVYFLVSELYIYQNARCNDKNCYFVFENVHLWKYFCKIFEFGRTFLQHSSNTRILNGWHWTKRKVRRPPTLRTWCAVRHQPSETWKKHLPHCAETQNMTTIWPAYTVETWKSLNAALHFKFI